MFWMRIAAVLGFLGIALGAFGAHALKKSVPPERMDAFKTGVLYHLVHVPVVLVLGMQHHMSNNHGIELAAGLLCGGVGLFSGSLYLMTLTGIKKLGIITPIGGLLLMAGWAAAFVNLT